MFDHGTYSVFKRLLETYLFYLSHVNLTRPELISVLLLSLYLINSFRV